RNLPRRLDVFDALDAGLRMQRVFTPAAKAGILLDPPQALGGVPEGEREHRTRFVSLRKPFCSSDSEVLADDFGCLLKLGPCTSEHYRSETQQEEQVPYGQGQPKILLDQENGYAARAALKDPRADRVDHAWRKSLSGLVKHEELRFAGERSRDRKHLLLTAAEVIANAATLRLQVGKKSKRLPD